MTVRGWGLFFDWSGSGEFTGPYDDVSSYVADADLAITIGRDTSQAASSIPAGTMDFTLQEKASPGSYIFSPETGPLSDAIFPGVRSVFSGTVSGATVPLFDGVLDAFNYDPTIGTMTGTVRDSWGTPGAEQLSTTVYSGYRTGDLIGVILDAIGWTGGRSLDPGATVVPYWWAEGKDAATAIQELVDSEGPPAIAYVDAGTFVFHDRHHRITSTASTTSQATYTHIYPQGTGPAGDFKILQGEFNYAHGRSSLINSVTFQVDIRQPTTTISQVWTTDTPVSVPANTSVSVFVKTDDPFVNAQTPTSTPVFLMEDGTLVADYVVASGSVTATIDRTSGQSAIITLTAGGTDSVVSSLALRANPLAVTRTVKVTNEDSESVATVGRQTWPRTLPWAGAADAYAIAARIVSAYAAWRPVLTFTIDSDTGATYLAQFANRKISDRITVRHDIVGLNGDYMIEKITRTVKSLGAGGSTLTVVCEAADPTGAANPLTFDVAGAGFNNGAFQMDGIDSPTTVLRFDTAGQGFNQGRFAW